MTPGNKPPDRAGVPTAEREIMRTPTDSHARLFLRFLRFGALAWGGPVAQIDMIRHELVQEEKWTSPDHFRRLLAIYQVLPGPEAHELCVHFGMIARGRWGGVLAGLGFMLPGFALMFLLSWLYVTVGPTNAAFQAVLLGMQPAVVALIARACHRIAGHSLTDRPLWIIGGVAAAGEITGVSFWLTLPLAGLAYAAAARQRWVWSTIIGLVFATAVWQTHPIAAGRYAQTTETTTASAAAGPRAGEVPPGALFASGLQAGLLTFGGAYTAIPFLKNDVVDRGRWMTENDFLDGVALSGVLPAPLIIFSTFVGYFGGGPVGALAITLGIFLPAFGFSLLFFRQLEAVMSHPLLRHFLEGVTAAVVGLIAVTAAGLALSILRTPAAGAIFASALAVVILWKSRWAVPTVVGAAGLTGWLIAQSSV